MKKTSARELATVGIFTALTAILAQIIIPLPPPMVQISMGLVGVYAAAILLKPRHAVLAQAVYLLLGAAGLPVFGGFRGGLAALLGPTGGYLFVYPAMAWIVSFALNSRRGLIAGHTAQRAALAMLLAHTVLYAGGTAWLSAMTGNSFMATLAVAVYPYIALDAVKIAFCAAVIVPLRSRLMAMRLLLLDAAPEA